jgi:chemotaxis protein MotB
MTTAAPSASGTVRPQRTLWLITFVDLVMLLLAFFVLLFSMSTFDRDRFTAVARSYVEAFQGLGAREVPVGPIRVPAAVRLPGDNLAYLEAVLRNQFARDPRLGAIQFRMTAQYLILDVPAQMVAADLASFDDETLRRFFALGGALSNVPNRIAIVASVAPSEGTEGWSLAAAHARHAQSALRAAGYGRATVAYAQGAPAGQSEATAADSLQVIVFPETSRVGEAR